MPPRELPVWVRVLPPALVAGLWTLAAAWARGRGFVELSDDDYARVTIAQAFAAHPRLDPSGTSWLPFPFWLTGAVMAVFGRSLAVARALSLVLAGASGALVYLGGRRLGLGRQTAFFGAVLPLVIPLVPVLGAATVPELPTAALLAYALASSTTDARGALGSAGLAVLVASLSRYDAWPIAALLCAWSLVRAWLDEDDRREGLVAAALSAAGPLLWLAWNAHAHGDALRFAGRVAAYGAAIGYVPDPLAYARAVVELGPVHVLAAAVGVLVLGREGVARTWLLLVGSLVLVAGLTYAALRGGTPTHHPERAVVTVWLVASLAFVATAPEAWAARVRVRPSVLLLLFLVPAVVVALRRPDPATASGTDRTARERATGEALQGLVARGDRVLVVPTSYAYLATVAAFGRPEDVEVVTLRSFDPRGTTVDDPTASPEALREAARARGVHTCLLTGEQAARAAGTHAVVGVVPAGVVVRIE